MGEGGFYSFQVLVTLVSGIMFVEKVLTDFLKGILILKVKASPMYNWFIIPVSQGRHMCTHTQALRDSLETQRRKTSVSKKSLDNANAELEWAHVMTYLVTCYEMYLLSWCCSYLYWTPILHIVVLSISQVYPHVYLYKSSLSFDLLSIHLQPIYH